MGKHYNKEGNTEACRKWRQKNKWILKMRARALRARKKLQLEADKEYYRAQVAAEIVSIKSPRK